MEKTLRVVMVACLAVVLLAQAVHTLSRKPQLPEKEMKKSTSTIEEDLMKVLDPLGNADKLDVLVYPGQSIEGLESFLLENKKKGMLDFNYLQFANCFAVKASKKLILEISGLEEVSRVAVNPSFSIP